MQIHELNNFIGNVLNSYTAIDSGNDTGKILIDDLFAPIRAVIGTPLVASTVSAMTDHNKIYVYTGSETGYTAGNWYYWNGSAWTNGGVYNSIAFTTDPTLSIAGAAADAEATGEACDDLMDAIKVISNGGVLRYKKSDGSPWGTNGYIDVDSGGLVPHANYTCYMFDIPNATDVWFASYPSSFCEIAVYNGEPFRSATLVTVKASSRNTLPTENTKLSIAAGMTVAVCIPNISDFVLKYTAEIATAKSVPVIIHPVSSSLFHVNVLDTVSGKYLTHEIKKIHQVNNVNGNSIVTEDVWMANYIIDNEGNTVGFGNLNFIHNLDITGHKGHVGAGHGCCAQVFTQFFADGMPFDPTTLSDDIECKVFSLIEKVNHYLIDEAATTNPDNAIPTLNENNEPIIESVQYLSAEYEANNRIHIRNRLDIKYDGTKYIGCYAAMLDVPAAECPNVIINNHQYLWTQYVANGSGYTRIIKDGGSVSLGDYGYDGDMVVMFGDKLKYTQRIISTNPDRSGKLNTYLWCAQAGHDWNKAYLMPCVATRSNQTIADGHAVETFNNGDILDVDCFRTIDILN